MTEMIDSQKRIINAVKSGTNIINFSGKSIVEASRMAMTVHPDDIKNAAKMIGCARDIYGFIRRLLIVRDKATIEERQIIDQALRTIDAERRVASARRLTQEIVARYVKRRSPGIPAGQSLIASVQAAMMKHPYQSDEGARSIGVAKESYRFIRKLLILKDQAIPAELKASIEAALIEADKSGKVDVAHTIADAAVETLWQKRRDPTRDKRDQKRFEQTLIHIHESCESTRDMVIPRSLTPKEVHMAVVTLATSIRLIGRLMSRVLGEEGEN